MEGGPHFPGCVDDQIFNLSSSTYRTKNIDECTTKGNYDSYYDFAVSLEGIIYLYRSFNSNGFRGEVF